MYVKIKTDTIVGFYFERKYRGKFSMEKGQKRRLMIQEQTKKLIYEKGYSSVTMSDIAETMGLSTGGLYYHYHSVESIVLDIFNNSTTTIWGELNTITTFTECLNVLHSYFIKEKMDLLNFSFSVNSIIYQYFFSFPETIRAKKMNEAYQNVLSKLTTIFSVFMKKEEALKLSNHIYIVLHGLTSLAMTGSITESIIDDEFQNITDELYRNCKYQEKQ